LGSDFGGCQQVDSPIECILKAGRILAARRCVVRLSPAPTANGLGSFTNHLTGIPSPFNKSVG
jgi:hypothetical protein